MLIQEIILSVLGIAIVYKIFNIYFDKKKQKQKQKKKYNIVKKEKCDNSGCKKCYLGKDFATNYETPCLRTREDVENHILNLSKQ
jgi:hypothetical protein